MALLVIPEQWRTTVCALLESKPDWDPAGYGRFLIEYPSNWHYEAVEAIRAYLESDEPKGCRVQMNYPAGETYEFFFLFLNGKTYGKVLLTTSRKSVVIFSAHRPTGPKLRCG